VTADALQLEPGATYHYRVVAENGSGVAEGNDRTLMAGAALVDGCSNAAVRRQQRVDLPGCMGLEMASPPKKFSQNSQSPSVSADGGRVLFASRGALGDPDGMLDTFNGDLFVSTRGGAGWGVESTVPSVGEGQEQNLVRGWHDTKFAMRSFSPDFSRWVTLMGTATQDAMGVGQAFGGGLGGVFSPLSPVLEPLDRLHSASNLRFSRFEGLSADHSRLYFKPGDLDTSYLAGDPSPAGTGAEPNVYVAGLDGLGAPGLELLSRDGDGKAWGERCGARLGGMVPAGFAGVDVNGRSQGAVSADGARAFFSTRPGQADGPVCDSAANKLRIMRRVAAVDGPEIAPLFDSECDRVAPACDTTDGDDLYQGASVDGTKVYFTTTRQLTDSDLDTGSVSVGCSGSVVVAGCDLYLYDSERPVGNRLVQVSEGTSDSPTPGDGAGVFDGIAAVSGDGSHAYFVATGVLTNDTNPEGVTATAGQPNLYSFAYDDAHPDGEIAFVGTAAAADGPLRALWGASGTFKGSAYPVPATGADGNGVEVGGDGHVLVFQSRAPFTADDSDGGSLDVFRYDTEAGELERVSKAAPGGSDNAPVEVALRGLFPSVVGTDFAEYGRWVSEDADTVLLSTPESLVADDLNGVKDDYVWRAGEVYRLPGATDGNFVAWPSMSHDGSTIAYVSRSPLLPQDGDQAADIYVARTDGGYLTDPETSCDPLTEDCQGPGAPPAGTDTKTSGTADGNVPAAERKQLALGGLKAAQKRRAARTGVIALRVRASQAGRVALVATGRVSGRTRRLGRTTMTLPAGAAVTVELRLNRAARRQLKAGKRLRLRLQARSAGARAKSLAVTLQRTGK
jgi:hypothetical protein